MNPVSPRAAAALAALADKKNKPLYKSNHNGTGYTLLHAGDSLWMLAQQKNNIRIAFRMACAPSQQLTLVKKTDIDGSLSIEMQSPIGHYHTNVFFNKAVAGFRYTTRFTPDASLLIPFWPRDIIVTNSRFKPGNAIGQVHVKQTGTRSGLLYFTPPGADAVLYIQNLAALNEYCEQTGGSFKEVVGGQWPELGLSLPSTTDKSLLPGVALTISDAIVQFGNANAQNDLAIANQFLDLLAAAYLVYNRGPFYGDLF